MIYLTISLCILFLFLGCDFIEKKVVVEGLDDLVQSLDPAKNLEASESRIFSCIYESLLEIGSDYSTLEPGLAEEWEISRDLRTFRFHLRRSILFHDGSPLTAEAVVYSFRRQIELNSSSPLFNMIAAVRAVDSMAIEIELRYPYAQFLYTLTSTIGLKAVSQKALQKYGDDIAFQAVGSGPFMVKEFFKNEEIHLTANPDYRSPSSGVDEVIIKCYEDYFKLEEDLRQQKLDLVYAVPGFSIDRLKWQGKIDYQVLPSFNVIFLGFNCQQKPFSDKNVRQAVLEAIDVPDLVNNIYRGKSLPAEGPIPPILFNNRNIRQSEFNLQQAKKLLTEAGYPNGFSVKFFYLDRLRPRRTLLEAIEVGLQKLNIKLEMIPFYSWTDLNAACRSDSAQLVWNSWEADVLGDPENFLYSLFYSSSPFNFLHYKNFEVDHWLDQTRLEPEWEKRQILYEKIIRQIVQDTPAVFIFHVIPVFAYNRQKIKELPLNPYGMVQYHQIVLN